MSTSGAKCAAAVMPSELSIMHPTITIMPWARATAIIRSASRRLPHLASLMLIPSTAPTSGGMSSAVRQLSSAMTGSVARREISARPAIGPAERLLQHGDAELLQHREHGDRLLDGPAAVGVDPDLLLGDARGSPAGSRSPDRSQLDLEDGILRRLPTFSRIRSGVSSPIVNVDRGAFGIEPPQPADRHAEPLADQVVQRGRERGAGDVFPRSIEAQRRSVSSRSNGSSGIPATYTSSAASTVSGVSP